MLRAGNMGPLHEWLPEALWPKIKALEGLKQFSGLGDAMHSDSDDWLAWFMTVWKSTSESAYLRVDGVWERRRALHAIVMTTFRASRRARAVASRDLGTAAVFSAQTRSRRPSDTLERVERAAPRPHAERPRIEGRLNFDVHTGSTARRRKSPSSRATGRRAWGPLIG